jgi:hypothetical protein
MKKSIVMVVLGLLMISLTVSHVQAGQGGAMVSVTLQNPVTIDGKWTSPKEWTDALQVDCGWGWIAVKDDSSFLYVLVDFVKDTSTGNGDWGFVSWDQKNDGGTKPRSDDYRLVLQYTNTTSFQSMILQGTGTDWGNQRIASRPTRPTMEPTILTPLRLMSSTSFRYRESYWTTLQPSRPLASSQEPMPTASGGS